MSTSDSHYPQVPPSYDLATCLPEVSPVHQGLRKSPSLPAVDKEDVFVVPKVNMSLKSRHRSRSNSSLLPGKTSRSHPPPLLTSNSDPNINVHKSALLAQLLTPGQLAAGQQNVLNVKSGNVNVPILPMPSSRNAATAILMAPNIPQQGYAITSGKLTSSPESPPEGPRSRGVTSPPEGSRSRVVTSPAPPPCTSPLLYPVSTALSPNRSDTGERSCPQGGGNEHRRTCHINAEQKRRYNIRNGFETLHSLIPHLQQNPNVKLSKAAMLQKGAEYIKQLQAERLQVKEEMEGLRYQVDSLNSAISNCQALLPATGAPISRHRTSKMKEMFHDWVRARTLDNWSFWIFSVLFEPLLTSFNCSVSSASYEDLYRSTLMWVEQHCSLVDLRPAVLNSLRYLSTSTDILTDPQKLPEEARAAISKSCKRGDRS